MTYNRDELYQVGAITNTHGIKGEVKVFPMTDDVNRFKGMKEILLDTGKEILPLEVTSARAQKNLVILKFKGLDSINDVEKYKSKGLYVTKENRVPLAEGEYFIADLIGCSVFAEDGEDLGQITGVLQTGANDVWVCKKEGAPELLLPKIPDCILQVDIEGRRIDVHLMEGLR